MFLTLDGVVLWVGGAFLYTYETKSESYIIQSFISLHKPCSDVTLNKFLVNLSQGRIVKIRTRVFSG